MYQAIKCTDNIVPRCDCMPEFIRNLNKQCVSPIDCPPEEVSCPANQVFRNCFGCIQRYCSDVRKAVIETTAKVTPVCLAVCNTGCVCETSGFVIDDINGAGCILADKCPPKIPICKANEYWNTCASSCPRTCANMYLNIICNKMCNSRCDCIEGHVRNNAGECVLEISCPLEEIKCPANQQVNVCYSTCDLRTCTAVNSISILIETIAVVEPTILPMCFKICDLGCSCSLGFVFDDINYTGCIPIEDCPPSLNCSDDEYEDSCGNTCKPSCANPNPYLCIVRFCKPVCICKPPLVRDEITGECIDRNTCESRCDGINEVMYPTRSYARATCANYGQPRPEILTETYVCDCKDEYVFDEVRKQCVPSYLCNCPV